MKNQRSLGLGLALGLVGLALAPEVQAATITRDGSPLVFVSTVTVGDETWGAVDGSSGIRVVPLPDGATDVHLVPHSYDIDRNTAPRFFWVDRVPVCDTSWPCDAPRPPVEAPWPRHPKPPPPSYEPPRAKAEPEFCCFCSSRFEQSEPVTPVPRAQVRVVARDQVVAAARELAAPFKTWLAQPNGALSTSFDVPDDIASRLPSVARFAVIVSHDDSGLAFRMRGPFAWPVESFDRGGPRELIMLVLTAENPTGNTTLFPRALLRAEPPRLYLTPSGATTPYARDPGALASDLAEQLANERKPVHLERAIHLDPNDRTEPDASVVADLGLRKLSVTRRPNAYRLHRYRFRNVADIGFGPTRAADLPRPRESATAFVAVESHLGEPPHPSCPNQFGTCVRPYIDNDTWRGVLRASTSWHSGARLVEAPFSLATPVMRDPSPFPPLPTPVSATPAPLPAPSASASTPTPAKVAVPAPAAHGPRGCTCDTVPVPASGSGAALAALGLVVLGLRRVARSSSRGAR